MLPSILLAAFIGGAIRAAIGIRKYSLKKGQVSSIAIDGMIGAVCGAAFMSTVNMTGNAALLAAGLAGYVGADVVETLYKLRIKRGGSLV